MQSQKNIDATVAPSGDGGGIVYNITIKITNAINEAWMQWLQEEHIPEVLQTGCFTHAIILKLLETDEAEGPTYATQYFADSKAIYNNYIEKYAAVMRQKSFDKWGNQFIAFRSVMQVVS
jgi:hypothetical protein